MAHKIRKQMKDYESLPFSLDTESLAGWLETLTSLPPAIAASQLSQILNLLEKCKAKPRLSYPLLVILTSPILFLSNGLSGLNTAKDNRPLTKKSIKFAKLGLKLLRQLAFAFSKLVESKELSDMQMQMAIYYALQLNGYYLRNCYLLYEIPSDSLWKKSAVLYKLANVTQVLNQNLTPNVTEFRSLNSIINVLKRNLLFSLFQPSQYTAEEIGELFRLSSRYFDLVEIGGEQAGGFCFYWNLEGEEPSAVKGSNKRLPTGFMAIDCRPFANALHQSTIKTTLKPKTRLNWFCI